MAEVIEIWRSDPGRFLVSWVRTTDGLSVEDESRRNQMSLRISQLEDGLLKLRRLREDR